MTTRRNFLRSFALLGVVLATPALFAQYTVPTVAEPGLVDSPPSLQCPTNNAITVVWTVGQPATGYIQYGTDKGNLDQTAYGGVLGQKTYHQRFMQIRIEGLQPNTRYFYRTVTRSFHFNNAYSFRLSEPEYSEMFSFETPGENKTIGTFSMINDTHNSAPLLKALGDRLREFKSDYTIWNGDLVGAYDSERVAIDTILRPGGAAFAMEKPLLFVPGNHDYRGEWSRNLPLCLPTWDYSTPGLSTGRNFVVRMGPLALIGLDTGEDKPDYRDEFGGLALFEPYRKQQRDWLEKALQSEIVASAPFVVAFCHIPIFDSRRDANGGNLPTGYASFQSQASELWGPLLTRHGVQVVLSAHTHRHRYDEPTKDRTWVQIVGGGSNEQAATIIRGKAEGDKLEIIVGTVTPGEELGRWTFAPRRTPR